MQEQMITEIRKTKIKRPFLVDEELLSQFYVSEALFANIRQTQIGTVQDIFDLHLKGTFFETSKMRLAPNSIGVLNSFLEP